MAETFSSRKQAVLRLFDNHGLLYYTVNNYCQASSQLDSTDVIAGAPGSIQTEMPVPPSDFLRDDSPPPRRRYLAAGLVLLVQGLSIFAPMAVLGGAIQWPDSLDFPPAQVLPLLRDQLSAVRLGYGLYLGYSVLFLLTGALTVRLAARPGPLGSLALVAIGAAAASALARSIGILRWLTGSVTLAEAHAAAGLSAEGRAAIEMMQAAINAWGGAVGEALGVAIFASLWAISTSLLILRDRRLPVWAGVTGLMAGGLVAFPSLELLGIAPPVSIVLSTTGIQLWFMALGLLFLWRGVHKAADDSGGNSA